MCKSRQLQSRKPINSVTGIRIGRKKIEALQCCRTKPEPIDNYHCLNSIMSKRETKINKNKALT